MPRGEAEPLLRERVLGRAAPLLFDLAQPVRAALTERRQGRGVLGVALAQVARGLAALLVDGRAGGAQRVDATCVEIKMLRRVRAESSRRSPRHRRDACSMAWRCRFLAARPSQVGRVIAEKCTRRTG